MTITPDQKWEIVRSISKVGDFNLVPEDTLVNIQKASLEEKLDLYLEVKNDSFRDEPEWREEFIQKLNIPETELPECRNSTEIILNFLEEAGNAPTEEDAKVYFQDMLSCLKDYDKKIVVTKIKENGQEYFLELLQ